MLDSLFKPKTVALIGASTKELSIGNVIIKNLQKYGFKGSIYPINPKAPEIRGLKSYSTILDIPESIDVAHIVIPPQMVPQAVEDCGKKGVKNVIINTAGFKEMGAEGEALQNQFVENGRKYGVRMFGPNCQGIINTDPNIKAYCNFTFTYPKPGNISIIAQSGGVGAIIMQYFFDIDCGIRMYASNGNACDISIPEIIKYWGEDTKTKVIILYAESLDSPQEFIEAATKAGLKKPILALNAGRTEQGAKAASSHTGGLAGGMVNDLIFKKSGILAFNDLEQMCQAAIAFSTQPIPKGLRVGMITNTGGPAIIATDELSEGGLVMPSLTKKAENILRDTMLEAASINNPIDVVATAGAPQFRSALDVMMDEEQIDSVFINFVTPPFVDCPSVAKEFVEVAAQCRKPMVCNFMTDKSQFSETVQILKAGGIPCYDFPGTAAKALISLSRYGELQKDDSSRASIFNDCHKKAVRNIIDTNVSSDNKFLGSKDVYEILNFYNIPTALWKVADTADEAIQAAEEVGYPVAVKVESTEIIHKSDMGGVIVNLKNNEDVSRAVLNLKSRFFDKQIKYLVQNYIDGGIELIVGAKAEKGVGHIIMFGMGGIYVDILKDISFELAPVAESQAFKMISAIKAYPLLKGYRGQKGVDLNALTEVIQRISQLVSENPLIKELDLNPIKGFIDGVCVVDARIKI